MEENKTSDFNDNSNQYLFDFLEELDEKILKKDFI